MCIHIDAVARQIQKRALVPLDLELQLVVIYLTWVLGIELVLTAEPPLSTPRNNYFRVLVSVSFKLFYFKGMLISFW